MTSERIEINKSSSLYSLSNIEEISLESFDRNNSKYLCCCGLLHSTTGVKIITFLLDLALLFLLARIIINILEGSNNDEQSLIFRCFMICPHALSMTWAIWKENSSCMIPFITLQIVGLFIGCFQVLALLYIIITEFSVFYDISLVYHISTYIIIITFQVWFILIVISCWKYYCDKRHYEAKNAYPHFILIKPTNEESKSNKENESSYYELENLNSKTILDTEIFDSEVFI
uniref:XK-related protein n=1 Tax=Strongyloides stercoralis TaxID=6248 RepID=A0A0K0DTI2_STRER